MLPAKVAVLFALLALASSQGNDDTVRERSYGRDVTEAVIRRISSSSIFPEDHSFLTRLAYVESKFGTNNNTFRTDYYGGIWGVEESVFRITQTNHSSLNLLHIAIRNRFGIDWQQMEWKRLVSPLYSGLAAALYFARVPESIPQLISEQATHWKKWYRPLGEVSKFIEDSEELRNETRCRGKMDLAIVLDSSGSINMGDRLNYARARNFTAELIESFTLDFNRIGMLIYSDNYKDVFPIMNNLTISEMSTRAREAEYLSSGTRTDLGILRAVTMFNSTPVTEGVPRLLFVFTDGNSDKESNMNAAFQAIRSNGLKSVAVGIGSSINRTELEQIALNDTKSVFELKDFQALQDFLFEVTSVICETPQRTTPNTTYNDTLLMNEKRLYEVDLPQEGITIDVKVQIGQCMGYWSRTERVPSSAVYDGKINGPTYIPPAKVRQGGTNETSNSVFVTIQGVDATNNYTLSTLKGNHGNGAQGPISNIVLLFLIIPLQFLINFTQRNPNA